MTEKSSSVRSLVGRRIRQLRTNLSWSQEKLGEEAGIHPTYVGGIERGERNLSLETLFGLAEALSVPASELVKAAEIDSKSGLYLKAVQYIKRQDEIALRQLLEIAELLERYRNERNPQEAE